MTRLFNFKTALAATALASGGLANATITFDGPGLDSSEAPLAPYFLTDRDALRQDGLVLRSFNINNGSAASDGSLTGALINGNDSQCDPGLLCPRTSSTYLATVNDAVPYLVNPKSQYGFLLKGFSASFIGAPADTLSQSSGLYAGLIRLYAVLADGRSGFLSTNFWLDGTDTDGQLNFQQFTLSEQDSRTEFVEIDFVGYGCDDSTCSAFSTNRGQFALDDIDVLALPEPASVALIGIAGLAAFATGRRRRAGKA